MEGIIKRWSETWGIIYSPGNKRYFLHVANIKSGTPELDRFVRFEIGPPRRPTELPMAIKAEIVPEPLPLNGLRATAVRS
jgi:hypothetical protein